MRRKQNNNRYEEITKTNNANYANRSTNPSQVHKNALKVRLIINTKGSSYYKIAKFVSRELKTLTTSATSFIKDSEQFVNKLKNIQLQEGEKIVSLDIEDMYP